MAQYKDTDVILRQLDEYYITAIVQQKHDDVPEDHKKHWKGVQSGINYARNTIIDAPTANVALKSEWISVEDRLPTHKDGKVLIYTAYGISIGEKTVSNRWRGDNAIPKQITHWMPLPTPPTEKEN